MHKKDNKSEIKAKFKRFLKRSYMNVFLVFAMVLVIGVLFNAPTSAQGQLPRFPGEMGLTSQEDFMAEQGSNQLPNIISLESDKPGPQEAGSSIKWTARAVDPENDPLSYMFWLRGPSTRDAWLPATQWIQDSIWYWNTTSEDAGRYQISVWVRDPAHTGPEFKPAERIVEYQITQPQAPAIAAPPAAEFVPPVSVPEPIVVPVEIIPVNQPPTLGSLAADQASPQVAGAAVTFTATASDPESDPVQYMFLLDGQPRTDFSENPSWAWTTSAAEIGSHSIEVRARDNNHNPDGDSSQAINFAIEAPPNNPPAVADLVADLASPQVAGAAVTFTATASDPENDPVQYMFLLDGQPRTDFSENPSWAWTTSAAEIGSHSIEVKARDNQHNPDGDSSKAIDFAIEAPPNNPPAVADLVADLASPQVAGAAVTFTATASDPESDPVQYMFLLDGQPRTEFSENPSWAWTTSAAEIGSHSIEVRARDNNAQS